MDSGPRRGRTRPISELDPLLTFARSVQVDTKANLRIDLKVSAVRTASAFLRFAILLGVFVLLGALAGVQSRLIAANRMAR